MRAGRHPQPATTPISLPASSAGLRCPSPYQPPFTERVQGAQLCTLLITIKHTACILSSVLSIILSISNLHLALSSACSKVLKTKKQHQ